MFKDWSLSLSVNIMPAASQPNLVVGGDMLTTRAEELYCVWVKLKDKAA
jgi:hypothetical protein